MDESLMERRRVRDEGREIVNRCQQGRMPEWRIREGRYLQRKPRLTPCQQPR